MMGKKKKIIILSVMVVLLALTAYLNVALNNKVVETQGQIATSSSAGFFSGYRDDRQTTRDSEIAYYDAIVASESTSAESKATAEAKRLELVALMESELVMEGLIKSKGFEDVVVTTSTNNINVVVKSGELSSNEVSQIVDIISDQTGKDIDNIKIIPVE